MSDALGDVEAVLRAERAAALAAVADLERVIAGVVEATEGANTDDEHDPEGATIAFERAQASAVRDRQLARVREVDEALARVAVGTFGTCARCGRPIAPGRLLARPTATHCITCAS